MIACFDKLRKPCSICDSKGPRLPPLFLSAAVAAWCRTGGGQAEMNVWLLRRNKMKGIGFIDVDRMFRSLVAARHKIELTYYEMLSDLEDLEEFGELEMSNIADDSLVLGF